MAGENGVERDPMQRVILEQLAELRKEQREGFQASRTEFNNRLDRLVTNEAFLAEQRRVSDHMTDLSNDVILEAQARAAAIVAEAQARLDAVKAIEQRMDKIAANLRWVATSVVLPIALFVATIILGGKS